MAATAHQSAWKGLYMRDDKAMVPDPQPSPAGRKPMLPRLGQVAQRGDSVETRPTRKSGGPSAVSVIVGLSLPARRGPDGRRDARSGHCARVLVLG